MKVVLNRFYTYKFSLLRGHGFISDLSSCGGGLHDKFMIGGVPVQFCHPMFDEILEGPIISQSNYEPESVKKNHLFLNQELCLYPFPDLTVEKPYPSQRRYIYGSYPQDVR